jgi:hypothetical protein
MDFWKLSVGRTHLLSKHRCLVLAFLIVKTVPQFQWLTRSRDCAQWLLSTLSCTVHTHRGMRIEREFPKSHIVKRFGGRGRDRTGDPLLAKQVLSQLSYTP